VTDVAVVGLHDQLAAVCDPPDLLARPPADRELLLPGVIR
jgi:hypothetical protein